MYGRSEAATFVAHAYREYLELANRVPTDVVSATVDGEVRPGLRPIIDAALIGLGYRRSEIGTVTAADDDEADEWETMLAYVALKQLARDLGALFDVTTDGDSFRLSQARANLDKDLAEARANALAMFGTLSGVPAPAVSMDIRLDFYGPVTRAEYANA